LPKPIHIPKLGLTMKKATVVKWLKNEGEAVVRDKPIALIETEKVSAEIQAPDDGVLLKVLSPKGSVVPVGAVIGYVGQPGDPIPEPDAAQPPTAAAAAPTTIAGPQGAEKPASADVPRRKVSPRAKMLADEKGIDLSKVVGSGPGNIVMERDVLDHIQNSLYRTAQGLKVKAVIPMSATRKAIAENMVSSLQSMAQVTLMVDVLAGQLEKRISNAEGKKVTYTDLLVLMVAEVLGQHPLLNSTLEDDQIKVIEEINIGVAVAADTGLVVPVIRGANKRSLAEVSDAIRELAEKAREGRLTLDEITGGTFTITNLGSYGVGAFTPIINPPQVAILGIGKVALKPVVEDGNVAVRPMMTLSLTLDHRAIDGHTAALFLRDLQTRIENPQVD
jgi:pyruvate dehydrogenase E2 component (dihydrolipoyllysine-residue acetyltransferase)